VYKGLTNTKIFENFIKVLLLYCSKWLIQEFVLIIDNMLFHYLDKIQQMCNNVKVILLYLLLYLLNFNLIKEMFRKLKTYIKQV
jgi:DDE superfamily endonuclease